MPEVRVLHCADVHLDSSLEKMERYEGAPSERLRKVTREAFSNLIELAIRRQVHLLLIAGDLFDGPIKNVSASLFLAEQFRKLEEHKIQVVMIRGNHDAASVVHNSVPWPKNFHELSIDKPDTKRFDELGIAVHGQSFANRQVTTNIAANYPQTLKGYFNIGLLHTSLGGDAEHETYAPTSVEVLRTKGYQYWALGHIHLRTEQSLAEDFWVGYSGNIQGRHAKETGPKGCYLLTIEDGKLLSHEFCSTDVVRWHRYNLPIESARSIDEIPELFARHTQQLISQSEGRLGLVRLTIRGQSELHYPLQNPRKWDELVANLRNEANATRSLFLEKIILDTTPPLSALEQAPTALMEELRKVASDFNPQSAEYSELLKDVAALHAKSGKHLSEESEGELIGGFNRQQWGAWTERAHAMIRAELLGQNSANDSGEGN